MRAARLFSMPPVSPLLTPEGAALLASMPAYDPATAERLSRELRAAGYPPDLVSAALTQQRLRSRARAKLGDRADHMLFTENGAQQATRLVVAALHAQRYVRAGCTAVVDLTSGIGADAMALAEAGLSVVAVDMDEGTSALAAHNLAGFPNARTVCADSLELDLSGFDGVFADPARRSARGRTFNPADYSPPLDQVLAIRHRIPALGVKVAPGIAYNDLPQDTQAQWVSVDGSVVEAGLWFGPLAQGPGRSALVISGDEVTEVNATDDPRAPAPVLSPRELGRYLYEPDGAVIRSGALGVAGELLEAGPVSEGIAYLTGNALVRTPLATAFEVLEVVPLKKVRQYVREHGIGALEILKRGVDVVPDQFRSGLKLKGDVGATVVLTRLLGRHCAVFVQRLP